MVKMTKLIVFYHNNFSKKISRPVWRGIRIVVFLFFQSNDPEVYESEETVW